MKTQSAITTQAIDGFYAIWDDATKTISFSATEPASGTYEEVTGVKDFIQSHKDEVKTIDFAFTNVAGQSEKIVLGESEASELFYGCSQLSDIKNLPNLDTSNVTTMYRMFSACSKLTSLDLSGFDTGKVTDMGFMFSSSSLQSLDLTSFDTSSLTSMSRMFFHCHNMESIDLSSFDTSKVTNMNRTFAAMYSLSHIDVSGFDTSKVKDMYCMFASSGFEELDISNFDISSVGYTGEAEPGDSGYPGLSGIMCACPRLKIINVSGLKTNSWGKCFQNAFTGCYQLERITLSNDTVLEAAGRFAGCGLSGNWAKETDPDTMFTTADLIDKYGTSSSASPENATWIRYTPEGHYYRTDGTLNQDNMWEVHSPDERFKGYCLNKFRSGVSPFLDRVQITSDAQLRGLLDSDASEASLGYEPLGNSMEEALVTLLYYGWPNDKADIQAKYGLSDDEYMEVTQNAIWDFVDCYDNKSSPENHTPAMINAYNELIKQRYANIPEKYELYIYTTWDKRFQNLISIRSLTDGIYGGVEVFKQNQRLAPLSGAEFTIYDANTNEIVQTITSGNNGYASVCETDSYRGLPAGDYYVKETKAPSGFRLDNSTYYFSITESDKIVTLGKYGSPNELEEYMIFTDKEDTSYKGGGISVKKESSSGDALVGAEFTIYRDGDEVMTIISDEEGIAKTGARDLPLGNYTIKETKAPGGYVCSDEEKAFDIAENGEFLEEEFTFTNTAKQGKATLEATKELKGGKLKEGIFFFQLQTMDGEVLQTATNDADGNVLFAPITYTAEDQGYVNYRIVEVKGDTKGIVYDEHEELVTVTITDAGGEELECLPIYDHDGAKFENEKTIEPFIEKTIDDGTKVVLQNKSDEVTYTIRSVVPVDASNFKIIDQMPEVLAFADAKEIKVLFDGKSEDVDLAVKDSSFTMELNEQQCTRLAGSKIEITFQARIKEDVDLTPYQVGDRYQINNVARYIIDNEIEEATEVKGASLELISKDDETISQEREKTTRTAKTKEQGEKAKQKKTVKKTGTVTKVYHAVKTGDPMGIGWLLLALCVSAVLIVLQKRRRNRM